MARQITAAREWIHLALCVLLGCVALAACASGPADRPARSHASVPRDVRLLGSWRVTSATVADHAMVGADTMTIASLRFRRDGLLITNGVRCGAPRFVTDGRSLELRFPRTSTCSFTLGSSERALRLATILASLTSRHRITFAVRDKLLILAGGRYRVVLTRGVPRRDPTPALSSSLPQPTPRQSHCPRSARMRCSERSDGPRSSSPPAMASRSASTAS